MTSAMPFAKTVQPKPLLITAGVHLLLLLILFLWRFSLPATPAPVLDSGMEVNLGTSETGSGTDQPMDVEDPAASMNKSRAAAAFGGLADMERSNDDDAPEVATGAAQASRNPVNNRTASTAGDRASTVSAAHQVQQPRFVYTGSNGRGGNSAATSAAGRSEGITSGNGDQGVVGGTPGAQAYSGIPGTGGGGYNFLLSGRSIERAPTEGERFREGGKVVVRVTVNRNGEIVNKVVKSSTNTELSPIALRRLQGVRFNKSETAPEEQFGTITFVFKTRQ